MAGARRRSAGAALLAALACVVAGCGWSSGRAGSSASGSSTNAARHKRDRDYDFDHNDDDGEILDYGHAASAADSRAVGALIRRYYRAAAAENGAEGCALLIPALAESVAEQLSDSAGLRAPDCARALGRLFELEHRKLAGEATVKVVLVRVDGERSLTMLSFANNPAVRQIFARRVDGSWKLREPFDSLVE